MIRALRGQPKSVVNNITTGVVLPESYDEARATGPLGDIPLIVLTAGQPFDFGDPELNRQAAAYQEVWIHEMQAGLAGSPPADAKSWRRMPTTARFRKN